MTEFVINKIIMRRTSPYFKKVRIIGVFFTKLILKCVHIFKYSVLRLDIRIF